MAIVLLHLETVQQPLSCRRRSNTLRKTCSNKRFLTSMRIITYGDLHLESGSGWMLRLTSRTESMAEPHRSFEHCFVGLLKTNFFIKSENFASRGQLLSAREQTVDLCPSQPYRRPFKISSGRAGSMRFADTKSESRSSRKSTRNHRTAR